MAIADAHGLPYRRIFARCRSGPSYFSGNQEALHKTGVRPPVNCNPYDRISSITKFKGWGLEFEAAGVDVQKFSSASA